MRQIRAISRLVPARATSSGVLSARLSFLATTSRAQNRLYSSPARSTLPIASSSIASLPVRGFASSSRSNAADPAKNRTRTVDMEEFPPERIRNLSIIAHIDHGKSTLADRLLQMTNTVPPESSPQFLDKLKVERERGITVKAQTVSIIHTHTDGKKYLINLIDTPGHVDFSYEVSRSLGACEGGLLLVDCTQGIQAQTLSVFHHALEADLKLLPVINKVDLPHAYPEETSEEIASSLGLPTEDHMMISAKSGLGVDEVLRQIVDGLPPPHWEGDNKLRALVFDTFYDRFRGVVSLIRILSGSIKKGDKVRFIQAGKKYEVLDIGIYNPEEVQVDILKEGQVGYLVSNMKNSDEAHIGDTVCLVDKPVEPLPGFKPMKAMVYAGVFPMDAGEFPQLEESINRLTLNDRSVSVERESSTALGQGFRLGFLGTLHMDVFRQRLEDEYESQVIVTAPTVPYKVIYQGGKEEFISNPSEFPDVTDTRARVVRVEEPMVNATIFVPNDYIGEMMNLCAKYRGVQTEYKVLEGTDRAILRYKLPLSEIVTDFFSDLKSASSGFASFDYEECGYEESKLVKLNMLLNGKPVDALAMIVHRSVAPNVGKAWVKKLKDVLPRQLFELAIQAAIGQKIVARETLSAMRKDVTAGLYGGHYERKLKHLNKQKEGKKRLKSLAGNIQVPQTAFYEVLSSRPRSYTTSARCAAPAEDWLGPHLPPLPPKDIPGVPINSAARMTKHHVAPQQRSEILSNIHRKMSGRTPTSSEELYADFSQLYLSNPSPLFSASELRSIARAMHQFDRRARVRMRQANERFETVVNALRDVVSDEKKATSTLELAILVSSSRHTRHLSQRDLHKSEDEFKSLFRSAPLDPARREQYARCLKHILYLCAIARCPSRLNYWWNRMTGEGIEPDSWAYLSRILVHGLMMRTDAAVIELSQWLPKVASRDPDSAVVLVNATIWLAARAGEWDVVLALYKGLSANETEVVSSDVMPDVLPDIVPHLARLQPSRITYAMLVLAFSYRGDLVAALTVLRHMIDKGHVPSVEEYIALFKGFARFGVVPAGPAGAATSAFPLWRDVRAESMSGIANPWGPTTDNETGQFTSNYGPSASALWTQSTLEELFHTFIVLPPTRRQGLPPRAPTPNAVYLTLLAFGRVTNADAAVVRGVLNAMTQKFGPGNPEGWVGWHEDKRLRRLRERVGA